MSAIYIPGIEMPKRNFLDLRIQPNGVVYEFEGGYHLYYKTDKAMNVPDHGRLIDADALKSSIICDDTDEHKILSTRKLHHELDKWIDERPTIIPAEEGET